MASLGIGSPESEARRRGAHSGIYHGATAGAKSRLGSGDPIGGSGALLVFAFDGLFRSAFTPCRRPSLCDLGDATALRAGVAFQEVNRGAFAARLAEAAAR